MKSEREETLWVLMRGQRLRYGGAILAMGMANVFLFGVPLVAKDAIDRIVAQRQFDPVYLWLAAGAVVALTAAGSAFTYLRGRWAAVASEAIVRRLRDRLYKHIEHLPCAFLDQAETGDLVQRCSSDVETVRVFLAAQVVEIGRSVLLVLTVLPVLLYLDARMALVSVALLPVIVAYAVVFFRRVKALFKRVDEAEAEMTAVLQENLTGIRVVRAFARRDHECARFGERNAAHRDLHLRLIRLLGRYWAVSELLSMSQIGLVLFCGGFWAMQGRLTVGDLFAFLTYINIVIWPVRHLGRVLADTGKATVSLHRLREVLEEAPESDGGETPPPLAGAIDVENLRFAFGDKAPVLDGMTLSIAPGETVALLGPPGAGKSSLVSVLLRLYDYQAGSVRLDGRELCTLDRKFVRSQFGVVLQEPFLYSKTVAANVRLGRSGASDEEVVESASAACIHDAIEGFDRGYETLVGERGVTLSGGQRQRMALARALLKDPPLLILDDALSAVDTETESRIVAALKGRSGRRTTLLIAHRLSSVLHADRILVLEKGSVVQAGTHLELAGLDGPYRRLWQLQSGLAEETA